MLPKGLVCFPPWAFLTRRDVSRFPMEAFPMRRFLSILCIPVLASALTLTRVSTPTIANKPVNIDDGYRIHDGSWVVIDSTGAAAYSADKGVTWTAIPSPGAGDSSIFMGDGLVNLDYDRIWTKAKGWHDVVFPPSWTIGFATTTYAGSEGIQARQVGSTIHYYRTDDGWETWKDWISLPITVVPEGADEFGQLALDKLWFVVADSGYARGTANGRTWEIMDLPSFETWYLTSFDIDSIVMAVGFLQEGNTEMGGFSLDRGKTWISGATRDPGHALVAVHEGIYLSAAGEPDGEYDIWASRDPRSGWVLLGKLKGLFLEPGMLLVAKSDGIYRVDGLGSAVQRRSTRGESRWVKEGDRRVLLVEDGLLGREWTIHGTNGARIGSGIVAGGRIAVPSSVQAGWVRIGDKVVPIGLR
jgi:hypothetical protein